ncbi:MAG: response regulator transcription factor [Candidatus Anammoxibacter sp.]
MAKILVIEDSLLTRTMMKHTLKGLGHEPVFAVNGEEGIKLAVEEKPECITLDLLLPGEMGGRKVLTALKEKNIDIPVVVVTSNTQDTVKKECLKLGAACVINKPAKTEELEEVLKKLLKP